MNKEEFLKKLQALREQKHQYEEEYIKESAKFPEGVKVKVTKNGKESYGIVKKYIVSYDEVVPYIHYLFPDGTESTRRISIKPGDKVELAD